MKLHVDPRSHLNTVTAYGPGFIEINAVRHTGHVIVTPSAPVTAWNVTQFDALGATDLEALLAYESDLVLLGTGTRQRLLHPRIGAALMNARVGLEVMNTPAACRTYNILMAEGRRVLAALLQEE